MAIFTVPTDADLASYAASFDLGALAEARGIEAGTVNTSYLLVMGGRRWFLRLYEEQGHDGAAHEAALLQHLARRGVPTPEPTPDREGTLVRTLAGKPAALFPWVEGDILCQKRMTAEAAAEGGAALARVHLAGPPADSTLGPGRFGPPDLAGRCDRVAASRDPAAAALAGDLRAAVLDAAARRDGALPRGLVHGDLFRDNVLWAGGHIAALLDFESAHEGPFAYDIAVTILSWCYGDAFAWDLARALVSGYRGVRELGDVERAGIYDEARLACLRFTITRITDEAIRVGKKWERFVARREAIESLGPAGFREALGL